MLSLALAFIQDSSSPQQQQQINNAAASMGVAFILIFMIVGLAFAAFMVFCYWRIFAKAGMNGAMSLIMLIPGVGPIVVLCILAFGDWKVVPIAQAAPLPPPYQPPPSYPPAPPPAV